MAFSISELTRLFNAASQSLKDSFRSSIGEDEQRFPLVEVPAAATAMSFGIEGQGTAPANLPVLSGTTYWVDYRESHGKLFRFTGGTGNITVNLADLLEINNGGFRDELAGTMFFFHNDKTAGDVGFTGGGIADISPTPAEGGANIMPGYAAICMLNPHATNRFTLLVASWNRAATGGLVRYGSGAPAGGLGNISDSYVDTDSGSVYEKTGSTTWAFRINLATDSQLSRTNQNVPQRWSHEFPTDPTITGNGTTTLNHTFTGADNLFGQNFDPVNFTRSVDRGSGAIKAAIRFTVRRSAADDGNVNVTVRSGSTIIRNDNLDIASTVHSYRHFVEINPILSNVITIAITTTNFSAGTVITIESAKVEIVEIPNRGSPRVVQQLSLNPEPRDLVNLNVAHGSNQPGLYYNFGSGYEPAEIRRPGEMATPDVLFSGNTPVNEGSHTDVTITSWRTRYKWLYFVANTWEAMISVADVPTTTDAGNGYRIYRDYDRETDNVVSFIRQNAGTTANVIRVGNSASTLGRNTNWTLQKIYGWR